MFCALATRKEDGSPPPRFSPRSHVLATQPLISVGPPRLSCRKHRKDPRMRLVQEIERRRRGLPRTECAIERTLIHLGRSRVGPSARPADSSPMTGRTHATAWCTLYVASTLAGRDGQTGLTNSPPPSPAPAGSQWRRRRRGRAGAAVGDGDRHHHNSEWRVQRGAKRAELHMQVK